MDKWICIAVCILISVLIYYLLKSYGINNIIEGQCPQANPSVLCDFNYEGSAQNICNSIIDPPCGDVAQYRIPCADICGDTPLAIPNVSPIPLMSYKEDHGKCCGTVIDDPWDCTDLPDATGSCNCRFAKARTLMHNSGFNYSPGWFDKKIGSSCTNCPDGCCNNFAKILIKYLEPYEYRDQSESTSDGECHITGSEEIDDLISNYNMIYEKIYGDTNAPCNSATGKAITNLPNSIDENFENKVGWLECCNDKSGEDGDVKNENCYPSPVDKVWLQDYPKLNSQQNK